MTSVSAERKYSAISKGHEPMQSISIPETLQTTTHYCENIVN